MVYRTTQIVREEPAAATWATLSMHPPTDRITYTTAFVKPEIIGCRNFILI